MASPRFDGGRQGAGGKSKLGGMVGQMAANVQTEATQEFLLGTWQVIGLIGDALVRSGAIGRGELLEPLAIAEALTQSLDRRHVAFAAVHGLISAADHEEPAAPLPCSGRQPRPRRRDRPARERIAARSWSHSCRPGGRDRGR
jgi:hypothetical protein